MAYAKSEIDWEMLNLLATESSDSSDDEDQKSTTSDTDSDQELGPENSTVYSGRTWCRGKGRIRKNRGKSGFSINRTHSPCCERHSKRHSSTNNAALHNDDNLTTESAQPVHSTGRSRMAHIQINSALNQDEVQDLVFANREDNIALIWKYMESLDVCITYEIFMDFMMHRLNDKEWKPSYPIFKARNAMITAMCCEFGRRGLKKPCCNIMRKQRKTLYTLLCEIGLKEALVVFIEFLKIKNYITPGKQICIILLNMFLEMNPTMDSFNFRFYQLVHSFPAGERFSGRDSHWNTEQSKVLHTIEKKYEISIREMKKGGTH